MNRLETRIRKMEATACARKGVHAMTNFELDREICRIFAKSGMTEEETRGLLKDDHAISAIMSQFQAELETEERNTQ